MLSIFRRIRQSLLKTGSFKRYFLYAIGEVILIVVGVLIAVSINSSNNFRVKRLQEQQIVARISNELDASIQRISTFQRRLQLTRFYHTVTQSEARSNLRMSEFPRIAYKLIPRERENELKKSLSEEEISEVVAAVLKSDLKSHLISEQNRAKFIVDNWDVIKTQSTELQSKLNARRRPGMLSESNFPSNRPSN